jgi:phosphohistidine phosphatase
MVPHVVSDQARTLLLLRHAKSSWSDPALADHDRPLAPRGRRAARLIASHLLAEKIHPALVLCSSARRTRDTLAALRPSLDETTTEVRIEDRLYGASVTEILALLRTVDPAVPSVMVIGHNPGLEDLALALAGDGAEDAVRQLQSKFPTGALATLDVRSAAWEQLAFGDAFLRSVVLPRELFTGR